MNTQTCWEAGIFIEILVMMRDYFGWTPSYRADGPGMKIRADRAYLISGSGHRAQDNKGAMPPSSTG
jgi:hypothetical protein